MYYVGGNLFFNIQQMAPCIIREEMVATCWALYRVFKSMEPLSFESPRVIHVAGRFPTTAKVFCIRPARKKYIQYIYIYVCVCIKCMEPLSFDIN